MDVATLQECGRFALTQRISVIRSFEVRTGPEGELVAFAEQDRTTGKEQMTLYADEDKQRPLAALRARRFIDAVASYDVEAVDGTQIGQLRKDAAKSLARSTWHLEQPGLGTATGTERSTGIAILRRVVDIRGLPSIPYHFDFHLDGQRVLAVEKKFGIKDRYVVTVEHPGLDRRLAVAQAIVLDSVQYD